VAEAQELLDTTFMASTGEMIHTDLASKFVNYSRVGKDHGTVTLF
jgi:hypothetical protein